MKITRWLGLDILIAWVLRYFLAFWVKPQLEPADIEELKLNLKRPICYVLPSRSLADGLVLDQACIEHKLPRPSAPLIVGLHREKRSLVYLKQPDVLLISNDDVKAIHRAPRLERIVAHVQKHQDLDVQIVPVSLFWGRSPDNQMSFWKIIFSDTWSVPGIIKKWFMILLHGHSASVLLSPPISLRTLLDSRDNIPPQHNVRKLSRILRVHFRRQREIFVGPDLSHRRTLVNQILATPEVRTAIEQEKQKTPAQIKKIEQKAKHYADEIAANYSYAVIRAFELLLSWLWNQLYSGVEVYNIERLKDVTQDYEIVYLPCHRSHIDYLLLSFIIYKHGMVPPHIAAGINLNLPVLGEILRRSGAFFMRRSFKGNDLYAAVFNEYLHHMLKNGFAIEYFIEGGRSRTGRSLSPKSGMLSMTAQSYLRDTNRPIMFVPVYIGYERIFEGGTYIGELHGRKKQKESWLDLLKSVKKLKENFGKVHLNFGQPICLETVFQKNNPCWRNPGQQDHQQPWFKQAVQQLAQQAMVAINQAAVLNPINLLSVVLLATPKHAMDETELETLLNIYLALFKQIPYAEQSELAASSGHDVITYGEKLKVLQRHQHPLGDLLYLEDETAIQLTYFRNNVIHLFAIPSLIACFVMNHAQLSKERLIHFCQSLYPFLQSDLFLHWPPEAIGHVVNQWMIGLVEHQLLIETPEGHLKPAEPGSAAHFRLDILANTIRQTLERYYVTLALLHKSGSGEVLQSQLEEECQLIAQRVSFLYEFHAPEFFDKTLFKSFIAALQAQNLIQLDEQQHLCFDDNLLIMYDYTRLTLSDAVRSSIRQQTGATLPTNIT